MNIAKNMEALFLVAAVMLTATTYATASVATHHASKNAKLSAVTADVKMQVVTITAARMTPAEKAEAQ